eukprot:GAHX01000343.1.p1 GENE.GAHX01000343.1~~GAHX01000343.1.p1  ORF type:complete len:262 (+),score=56.89 GAHX01000343.1:51-788(+)
MNVAESINGVFSSDGTIYQIENAKKATALSDLTFTFCGNDGILLSSVRVLKSPTLIKADSKCNRSVYKLSNKICATFSGLESDKSRVLNKIKKEQQKFYREFGFEMNLEVILEKISYYFFSKTFFSRRRTFGVSILLAEYDNEAKIAVIEPSGDVVYYKAAAEGKFKQNAKAELETVVDAHKSEGAVYDKTNSLVKAAEIVHKNYDDEREALTIDSVWIDKNGIYNYKEEELKEATEKAKDIIDN